MIAHDMSAKEVVGVVRDIINWKTFDDVDKKYWLYAFLNNWADTDKIERITQADKREVRARENEQRAD